MIDIQKLWQELIQSDEHSRLEAKPGTNIDNDVMQSVCSFSNTPNLHGGYLLMGIEEIPLNENKYVISGVSDSDKLQKDLATQCCTKFNRVIRPEIQVGIIEGKTVIGVFVPEVQKSEKPVFMKKQGMEKGTYIRVGSTDQVCTNDELLRLIRERDLRPFDETCLPFTEISDISPDALEAYRELRREKNPNAPEIKYNDIDLLKSLNCVSFVNGEYKPNIAGLILFGTSMALKKHFPMAARFDYTRVKGREWGKFEDDYYYSHEFWEPLITLLPKAEAAIMDDIGHAFVFPPNSLTRDEKPIIPYDAIREILVNSLMHKDYRENSPTLVVRFSDRIEFHNPGYSLKPLHSLGTPGSTTRNPIIANVLNETKYAENKGSGIAKVKRLMIEAQLPSPEFCSKDTENKFVAVLSLHQLFDEAAIGWLSNYKRFNLSREEASVLIYLWKESKITNEMCRNITGLSSQKSSVVLSSLRSKGIITQHFHGSATYYTLYNMDCTNVLGNKAKSGLFPNDSSDIGCDSSGNKAKSGLFPNDSSDGGCDSPGNKTKSGLFPDGKREYRDYLFSFLPKQLVDEIQALGGRLPPEKREGLLLSVLSFQPFTAIEIGVIFNKTERWGRSVCSELVRKGTLYVVEDYRNKCQKYCISEELKKH